MFYKKIRFISPYFIWFLISGYYLYYAINSAFQRDGAHFLFMANQICHGFPPYWASFETKTPFVEYLWCGFHKFGGIFFDIWIWQSARILESLYVLATVIAAYKLVGKGKRNDLLAIVMSTLCLIFLSDPQVTDNGFNISIYQPLTSLVALWIAKQLYDENRFLPGKAVLLGILVFLSWSVKQTSLLDIFPAYIFILVIGVSGTREKVKNTLLVGAIFCCGVSLFFLHLKLTNTLANYSAGAMSFHIQRMARGFEYLGGNFLNLLGTFRFPENYPAFLMVLIVLLTLFCGINFLKDRRFLHQNPQLVIGILWSIGCAASALIPLTFFKHYWLGAIVPVLMSCYLALKTLREFSQKLSTLAIAMGIVIFVYKGSISLHRDTLSIAPQTLLSLEMKKHISVTDTVFLWGGLPHFFVLNMRVSYLPQNMWWPFINKTSGENKKNLGSYIRTNKPQKIIQIYEEYPPYESLHAFPLSEELLYSVSNCRYEVLAQIVSPVSGRYAFPITIFELQSCTGL